VTPPVEAIALSAAGVAEAVGARRIIGPADRVLAGVSIDTRAMTPGGLFVALRGTRDGHAFVAEAFQRGAAAAMVSDPDVGAPAGAVLIVVEDTLRALQTLGHAVRRLSGTRVVAITGSAGKTTTKEATADLLSVRYRVFRNAGNLNNHIGLPLSLIELRHGFDMAVVELGMNHADEIRALVALAEPDVRVWTNVGDAHIGAFGSRDAVAAAKAEVLEMATHDTVAVVNADDAHVMAHTSGFPGRVITFGESASAEVRAAAIDDRGLDGIDARVLVGGAELALHVPLPGRGQLSNVLAAVAVAWASDVPLAAMSERVSALQPVARRGTTARLPNGARLVDDSYNASPAAVQMMLTALSRTPARRRIAVLGEMLELGDRGPALHEACGRAAVRAGVDELFVVGGPVADALAAGALAGGLLRDHLHRFADSAAAAPAVAAIVREGDVVLVKGSRGTRMDRVSDRLLEVA
jgi:UDP-N-acetylmuramoyl-tripeptide--D-alanyl-D-alanine ligase